MVNFRMSSTVEMTEEKMITMKNVHADTGFLHSYGNNSGRGRVKARARIRVEEQNCLIVNENFVPVDTSEIQ